jgi:hypothetical protein
LLEVAQAQQAITPVVVVVLVDTEQILEPQAAVQ